MSNGTSWSSHGIPLGPVEMGTQTFCVLLSIICFLSIYTFTSVVLLYYPTLLHRRKNLAFILPRHISHRGKCHDRSLNHISFRVGWAHLDTQWACLTAFRKVEITPSDPAFLIGKYVLPQVAPVSGSSPRCPPSGTPTRKGRRCSKWTRR